jgi:leader peptidase (prepilin peptidase) / N-methyltransferase
MDPITLTVAIFVFLLGSCVGSFLNVVVYRMPREMSLISPPSTCPKCGHKLAAYDNVPILGWLWLRGKCRYCRNPISPRYPIVELITGLLFLGHFLLLFVYGWGPYDATVVTDVFGITRVTFSTLDLNRDWPILVLHLWLIGALLAASLIDLEHFIIPLGICWTTAIVGVIAHAFLIGPNALGNLHQPPTVDAIALGGGVGLLLSLVMLWNGLLKRSFADDAPLLEKDRESLPEDQRPDVWPASRVRQEMRLEILFLLPPIAIAAGCAALVMGLPAIGEWWAGVSSQAAVSGLLGSLFGALIGGAVVWFFRIAGSYGFGREAMGLGDVHLMFGVGAIIGGGASTVAFFLAPAAGLAIALVQLLSKGRREIPYGPYLSLATYAVLLFYTPIAMYLSPGMAGLQFAVEEWIGVASITTVVSLLAIVLILLILLMLLSGRKSKT